MNPSPSRQRKVKAWAMVVEGEIKDIYWKQPKYDSQDFRISKLIFEKLLGEPIHIVKCDIIYILPKPKRNRNKKGI